MMGVWPRAAAALRRVPNSATMQPTVQRWHTHECIQRL